MIKFLLQTLHAIVLMTIIIIIIVLVVVIGAAAKCESWNFVSI